MSRPSAEVLEEVRQLADSGVREITLIGQNVNSYGRKEAGEISFAELISRVDAVEGIERIRFTTSHPKDLSDELIDAFGTLSKLCKHLHLPVQCGSDRLLRDMNRGYTRDQYREKVRRLKSVCPEIRLTSDVIVGFPGETEEDFAGTMELMAEVRFADVFSFLYSPRPGTAAAQLADDTPASVRQERFDRLLALQEKISRETWAQDVGRVLPVLVEGESKQRGGQLFGRSTWNRIVNFAGDPSLVGQTVPVRVTKSFKNSQLGELA